MKLATVLGLRLGKRLFCVVAFFGLLSHALCAERGFTTTNLWESVNDAPPVSPSILVIHWELIGNPAKALSLKHPLTGEWLFLKKLGPVKVKESEENGYAFSFADGKSKVSVNLIGKGEGVLSTPHYSVLLEDSSKKVAQSRMLYGEATQDLRLFYFLTHREAESLQPTPVKQNEQPAVDTPWEDHSDSAFSGRFAIQKPEVAGVDKVTGKKITIRNSITFFEYDLSKKTFGLRIFDAKSKKVVLTTNLKKGLLGEEFFNEEKTSDGDTRKINVRFSGKGWTYTEETNDYLFEFTGESDGAALFVHRLNR